ncbi:hypothetical protein Cgig2_023623 [Carnegiea gigantea]|uniref:Uncharacterized protein n=1 Tax=Carnegiea gigantea TaxID=171969 RepID=A0A9Q1KEP9_9CARY|nr:hypothetical protein Cgig2_023623 [Carnegiea gigantea]
MILLLLQQHALFVLWLHQPKISLHEFLNLLTSSSASNSPSSRVSNNFVTIRLLMSKLATMCTQHPFLVEVARQRHKYCVCRWDSMFSGSSNNMDIHVDVTDDDTGSEDIEMETHEIEQEQELELELEEVLRNKIKKELKRRGSTSACKPPQPEVSGLRDLTLEHPTSVIDESMVRSDDI